MKTWRESMKIQDTSREEIDIFASMWQITDCVEGLSNKDNNTKHMKKDKAAQ